MKKVIVLSKEGCAGCAAFNMLMQTDRFLAEQNIEIHKKEDGGEYDVLVEAHDIKSLPSFIYMSGDSIELKGGFSFAEDKKKLNEFFKEI